MSKENKSLILITKSPEATFMIGEVLGKALVKGDIVALIGELGSGKTLFTRGIAKGLNISDKYTITSPTFNLINEYPGRVFLYHMDIYRLGSINELDDIGFEEYFNKDGVVVIEWAEKIKDLIYRDALFIYLNCLTETVRKIEIYSKKSILDKISDEIKMEGVEEWL